MAALAVPGLKQRWSHVSSGFAIIARSVTQKIGPGHAVRGLQECGGLCSSNGLTVNVSWLDTVTCIDSHKPFLLCHELVMTH